MPDEREIRRARFADMLETGDLEDSRERNDPQENMPLQAPNPSNAGPSPLTRSSAMRTVSHVPEPPYQKLANPGPLGLFGFALTTFVLGLYECGAGLPDSNPMGDIGPNQAVFGLAIFMGGAAQFIAGIMQFRIGNTFGCTVHCSYGAFWLSYAMFLIPSLDIEGAYGGDRRAYSVALGIYLILWCFLTLLFLVGALRTNITILLVFFFLALSFFMLSLGWFLFSEHSAASSHVTQAGGAFAVASAFVSFYGGASGLMTPQTTWVRLPLGEITWSDEADML